MYSGLVRVVNEVGSWEGPYTSLDVIDEAGSNFTSSITGWLTGAGGYEGLSAYLVYELGSGTFKGHITAEGPPPTPESPTE